MTQLLRGAEATLKPPNPRRGEASVLRQYILNMYSICTQCVFNTSLRNAARARRMHLRRSFKSRRVAVSPMGNILKNRLGTSGMIFLRYFTTLQISIIPVTQLLRGAEATLKPPNPRRGAASVFRQYVLNMYSICTQCVFNPSLRNAVPARRMHLRRSFKTR